MAFVRPFRRMDTDNIKHICRATLPPTLAASEAAHRMAPYLWALQYTHLFPENCFVLEDGTGAAVGYVVGTPDVHAMEAAYPGYVAAVLQTEPGRTEVPEPRQLDTMWPTLIPDPEQDRLSKACNGEAFIISEKGVAQHAYKFRFLLLAGNDAKAKLVSRYRAQLHIALLAPFRGQGWGRQLVERFVESVQAASQEYDCGQGVHIGISGENTQVVPFYEKVGFRVYPGGEKEGNVWMVRDIGEATHQ